MKKKTKKQKNKNKNQKKHTPLQDSVRRYIREISVVFVFANPDRGGGGGTRETSPAAKSEEKRMFSQANPDRYVCMYITAFASISRTAFEIEALSLAVNPFRKKTKEHSEHK